MLNFIVMKEETPTYCGVSRQPEAPVNVPELFTLARSLPVLCLDPFFSELKVPSSLYSNDALGPRLPVFSRFLGSAQFPSAARLVKARDDPSKSQVCSVSSLNPILAYYHLVNQSGQTFEIVDQNH